MPPKEAPHESSAPMTTKRALSVLGGMIFLVIISLILPAKWFGITPPKAQNKKLNLVLLNSPNAQRNDISWNDLVKDSLSKNDVQIFENQKADPVVTSRLNDPDNLTASFSKNIYITSTYLDKNPNSTEKEKQELIAQLFAQEKEKIIPTKYTNKDIRTSTSEDSESLKKYGNSVATILGDIITEQSMTENVVGVREYIKDQNKSNLIPLLKDYEKIDAILQKLLTMTVPTSSSLYHIMILNKTALYRDTLFNLSELPNDPLRATFFIEPYLDTVRETLGVYGILSDYFSLQNVIFTKKEPGHIFTVGYTLK